MPGVVEAGLFDFSASVAAAAPEANCGPDMSDADSFTFEGRFRLENNLSDGYFVYRSTHRAAWFDGQTMVSVHEAEHTPVEGCEACALRVIETLEVALLSETQDEAAGGQCPCGASGGGIPSADGQNIFSPRPVPGGFDAVRACGTLQVRVEATPLAQQGCPQACQKEALVYYVEGVRRE